MLHHNMKKAQGLSLNTIVVAAIVLTVLLVVVFIFTGRIRIFSQGARSCASQKGVCTTDCPLSENIRIPGTDCEDAYSDYTSDEIAELKKNNDYKYCCVSILGE